MTTGEKLSRLRKENNFTQEQLSELLGVSRQAISKWESDAAYPETEKLVRLSKLYDCSVDYLLNDSAEKSSGGPQPVSEPRRRFPFGLGDRAFEKKSRRTVRGLPLWHINIGPGRAAKGIFAVGLVSRGVFSLGLASCGVFSAGLASCGVFSFGVFSLGLLAVGVFSLGAAAFGAIAAGAIAAGAVAAGIFSAGAASAGAFSVGALAVGKYAALGDHARAAVALGRTEAFGRLFSNTGSLPESGYREVCEKLNEIVPGYLSWAKQLFLFFV